MRWMMIFIICIFMIGCAHGSQCQQPTPRNEAPRQSEVEAGRIGGPLNGGGSWWHVKRRHGRWKLDKYAGGVRGWVS